VITIAARLRDYSIAPVAFNWPHGVAITQAVAAFVRTISRPTCRLDAQIDSERPFNSR